MAGDHMDTGTMLLAAPLQVRNVDGQSRVVGDYSLTRRIGVGGYGEVWQAVGPGGLQKAVKILHGRSDGRQADVEQKSLEKMRSVRHPFLLNIERIEVVDGRLIIVTELAEQSLEDRFQELRTEGHPGIPREELLAYLRDAADALDFLYDDHGLQHLDIKPANLLRQGNHVKVADFGLIKEVDRISESLINGFTPLYAPPELFEGKPSRNSDQYSLAVVYQVMLTGEPPFGGRNAAQIVAQHLSSRPDLSFLPPADQPAMARALSKNPRARFDTCRQFVDSLSAHKPGGVRPAANTGTRLDPSWRVAESTARPTSLPASDTQCVGPSVPSRPLPALGLPTAQIGNRPTLFIGIGGLGGKVLRQLRQRLQSKFGLEADLPSLPFLYLDTDGSAISSALTSRGEKGLRETETLAVPLRSPLEYRQTSSDLSEWLSRRWLYNIPRSGLVEGIRPLGRLAFVDHYLSIRERLYHMVVQALADQSVLRTGQQTNLAFETAQPAAFIVASISGGTGSGMVLDLGYLVRDVLAELKLSSDALFGVLLHVQPGHHARGTIPCANAVACLQELQYFGTRGLGYPGDHSRGLPLVDRPPFEHTYLLSFGSDSDDPPVAAETERIAEYLFRNAAAPEGAFFQEHRARTLDEMDNAAKTIQLRTFAVGSAPELRADHSQRETDAICVALLRKWQGEFTITGKERSASGPSLAKWAHALLQRVRLDSSQLAALAGTFLRNEHGRAIEAYAQTIQETLVARPISNASFEQLTQFVEDGLVPRVGTGLPPQHPVTILTLMRRQLDTFAQEARAAIRTAILSVVDSPRARLTAANEAVSAVACQIEQTIASLTSIVQGIDGDIVTLRAVFQDRIAASSTTRVNWDCSSVQDLRAVCHKYCVLKLCAVFYGCVIASANGVREATLALTGATELVRNRLRDLERQLTTGLGNETAPERRAQVDSIRQADLEARVRLLDERLRSDSQLRLFSRLLDERGIHELRDFLRVNAGNLPRQHVTNEKTCGGNSSVEPTAPGDFAANVQPRLSGLGGGHRVLAVVSEASAAKTLRQELANRLGDCVTIKVDGSSDPILCCETAGLDLKTTIGRLAESQTDVMETASRLHTRIDIEWRRCS